MANYVSKYTGAEIEAILEVSSTQLNSSKTANYVLAAPNGSAGKPTFRKLVAADIPTIKQDGVTGVTANRFGTCSVTASTVAKTVSITTGTFSLEAGARVSVKFTNKNTAGTPTLNVNSTGAKNIFHNGAKITTGTNKGMLYGVCDFVYDGTQWHLVGNYVNTTYSNATTTANGLMSSADKSILDNDIYRLPSSTATKEGILMGDNEKHIWGSGIFIQTSDDDTLDDKNVPTYSVVKRFATDEVAGTTKLVGYSKPSSTSAISTSDTLNVAIGKLEKALDGKASTSHASSSVTYGLATPSLYGHVKISNDDVNTVASANGLVAGMDHSHSNYALATKLPTFSLSGTVLTITDNS